MCDRDCFLSERIEQHGAGIRCEAGLARYALTAALMRDSSSPLLHTANNHLNVLRHLQRRAHLLFPLHRVILYQKISGNYGGDCTGIRCRRSRHWSALPLHE